ncbi:MAG: assimilatory sulfite reductase (NADPH) hemoprotein subunit [Gammaproteobacteria bacterium]|nr:assimilatory sulfite reductase (NADPH) hemoprotein subunit [Gammaproteobacteria bacterium]
MNDDPKTQRSGVEIIKDNSDYLRGTIEQGLADPITGAIAEDDTALLKFHGSYQQDDRDLRQERRKQKLEPAYSFMIRVRMPAGVCTPEQWLDLDRVANTHANGSLRLTTRQTFQLHGILKRNLKRTIREINETLLDTIAACGDVNRNVMCNPNPHQSEVHANVYEYAKQISEHLLPKTRAYHQIWLDEKPVAGTPETDEPLYGKVYLPRKFKVVIAVPPSNDVDIYAHDLGFIAIVENEKLTGFNVTVGGGMGMTHSEPETFPRLADVIGFCKPEQVLEVAEHVVKTQRDFGDRGNRKHARLKYTIDDRGVEWFKGELESRLGWALEPAKPYQFTDNGDRYGWVKGADGKRHVTLFIENGRIRDTDDYPMMTGLREIAKIHKGDFRVTANQNLIIASVAENQKAKIERLIKQYKLDDGTAHSALRLNSMACVAFPTCGLAMAESERYLPGLITKLEEVMLDAGLRDDAITLRMTGCPNGCARPYIAEIGFVGKSVGHYNVYLGGGFHGQRLGKLYREGITEEKILAELTPVIKRYAKERDDGEHFGDFVIRKEYVREVRAGRDFHS